MSFEKNLQNILKELKQHEKKSSINYYVKERLEKSLNQYYKELNNSINYLSDDRDVIKLAKKINK
ncbi:MAG: hypothetical protein SPJ27_02500 [Candidatus Onthovivens sp.]|nr:hypothetical protein [Candidatus Onthovivens sp.]